MHFSYRSRTFPRHLLLFIISFAIYGVNGLSPGSRAAAASDDSSKSEPAPARPNTTELEDRAFEAVNQERVANGLPPLRRANDLAVVAREHSRDMLERHYFAHTNPEGEDLRGRFARRGINNWRCIAENIAYNLGYRDPVAVAVESWMRSPGHRRNILNKRLTESGIGVVMDDSGRVYLTQVFATRD